MDWCAGRAASELALEVKILLACSLAEEIAAVLLAPELAGGPLACFRRKIIHLLSLDFWTKKFRQESLPTVIICP